MTKNKNKKISEGHDYYGRSSSPNSLLIWTHSMRGLTFHDEFQPTECDAGCTHSKTGIPAVTADAGITWVDVYLEATDRNLVAFLRLFRLYAFCLFSSMYKEVDAPVLELLVG